MKTALHKGLYDPASPSPQLNGTRCDACGAVFFPPLGIGCEKCGATADHLNDASLAAAGVLNSVATVHLHNGKDIDAPFTVGEVQLDDGPLIRALMNDAVDVSQIGQRVVGAWAVAGQEEDGDVVEPRFVLEKTNVIGGA